MMNDIYEGVKFIVIQLVINNSYFHLNLDDQCHPILDVNACHPKLGDQFHPLSDVYSVILSLYREINQKTSIFG